MRRRARLPVLALLLLHLAPAARGDCSRPEQIQHTELRSVERDSYPVGSKLTYRCIPGYELISGTVPQIICSDGSQWLPEAPRFCQGRLCPDPGIDNSRIISMTDLRLGDVITFACDEGYRMIPIGGDDTARCTLKAGKVDWDNRPSCQRIPCFPPPEISNGEIYSGRQIVYEFGSSVTYQCNGDYSLIGNKTLVCTAAADGKNGEWNSKPPECKAVQCPRPEIDHGRISAYRISYPYGHSLQITCDDKYSLSGASLITCGADSNWHPLLPTCDSLPVPTGTTTVIAPTTVPSGDGAAPGPTKPPKERPASTKTPKEEPVTTKRPEIESGSNNALVIVLGCLGVLILVAVIVFAWCYRAHHTKGKMDSGSSAPDSYRVVPQNTDMVLEEKREPSQV